MLDDDLAPLIQVMQRIYPDRIIHSHYASNGLVMPFDRDDLPNS